MSDDWVTPVPKAVFFTKGVGRHKYRPQSLELAMRHAGIEKYNFVQVSGILPAHCKIITVTQGIRRLQPGQIVFGAMSESSSDEPNRLPAKVQNTIYLGDHALAVLDVADNREFMVKLQPGTHDSLRAGSLKAGDDVFITFRPEDCLALDPV